jgi:hypothetical protein
LFAKASKRTVVTFAFSLKVVIVASSVEVVAYGVVQANNEMAVAITKIVFFIVLFF